MTLISFRLIIHMSMLCLAISIANVYLLLAVVFRIFSENQSWKIACYTAGNFWKYMQDHWENTLNGADALEITGDEIPQGEAAFVVCNHLCYSDTYLVQALAKRAGMLSRCRYFVKKEISRIPLFGWSFWAIGMILISRNWTNDEASIEAAFARVKQNHHDCWIIIYPEGTRRTPAKILRSRAFARQQGKAELQHLLFPRTKGFACTAQALRNSHIKYLYDVTLIYTSPPPNQRRIPTAADILSCKDLAKAGYKFHLHIKRIPLEKLPKDEEGLKEFCEDLWEEKDGYIDDYIRKHPAENDINGVNGFSEKEMK